jgi:hypothetical protein
MARTLSTLPAPKDRRRVVHVKGRQHVVETHPSANTTAFTLEDADEESHHKPGFLVWCWPAVFGLLLAIVADQLRTKVDSLWGDLADRLFFPWVQLVGLPELGLGDAVGGLPSLMLRLQFPIAGLYASWNLSRGHKLSTTIMQVAFVFGVEAFVLWLLTTPGASKRTVEPSVGF